MTSIKPLLRDHARKFDPNRYSGHVEVTRSITEIFERVLQLRFDRNEKVLHRNAVLDHLKFIVLDIFFAYRSPPYIYLATSRRAQDYTSRSTRYSGVLLSYRYTTKLLDELEALGLLEQFKGYGGSEDKRGYLTRICATKSLMDIFDAYGVRKEMINHLPSEVIKLRDEKKHFVDYEDTDATVQMRGNLELINQAIKKSRIRLGCDDREMEELFQRMVKDRQRGVLDFDAVELHRIFNNSSFVQGGRFYGGWWQRIPKEYRTYIYINYKNTMEIDYTGLHIRMLYVLTPTEN